MPARLEIDDGNPWWLSPDIWVVPGNDPSGPSGSPVAGQDNYLWARVHNTGDQDVTMARVDFYWSNPAAGVLRSNSTLVGSSFVDLAAGETQEVLCVTPWVPVVVNDGHECVVAQVISAADPLPTPLPDAFDPPTYPQVAQRNLAVVAMGQQLRFITLPIQLSTPARTRQTRILVRLEHEPARLAPQVLAQAGLGKLRPAGTTPLKVGLVRQRSCEPQPCDSEVVLEARPGTQQAVFLQLQSPEPFEGYAVVHVVEHTEERKPTGGITFLITHTKEG